MSPASGLRLPTSGLIVLIGCAHALPEVGSRQPQAGIAIAMYSRVGGDAYGVVDDRRWIDVTGNELVLEHVDPGAAMASLVIEPLAGGALAIGACARDRIPHALGGEQSKARDARKPALITTVDAYVPVVRCRVTGAPGKYLVRVLYVSTQLSYRAEHDIAMAETAHVMLASRFSITTPGWGGRADVTLFDGVPGGDQPPLEVARGQVTLDGATAVIAPPARQLRARLRRVARADSPDSVGSNLVWVWLELPGLRLAPGGVRVHLGLADEDVRDGELPPSSRTLVGEELRLRLWTDDSLRSSRQRTTDYSERAESAERIAITVMNLGTVPRDVWIEDPMRPANHRRIERALPDKLTRDHDLAVAHVTVAPGKVEHVAFTVAYDY